MAKLIKERELVTNYEYSKEYVWKNDTSCGFSFICDKDGCIDMDWHGKYALENIKLAEEKVKSGELIYQGISKREYSFYTPAIYKCNCGRKIEIEGDTQCECGQWFNAFGQELNPNWFESYYED